HECRPGTELPAHVAIDEKDGDGGRKRGRKSGTAFRYLAEGRAHEGDGRVHARRLRQERLAIEGRNDPIAAAQEFRGDDGSQTLGPIELARIQAVEEEEAAQKDQECWCGPTRLRQPLPRRGMQAALLFSRLRFLREGRCLHAKPPCLLPSCCGEFSGISCNFL